VDRQAQERIAHLERMVDDLSTVMAAQAERIDRLERRVALLTERAAEAEAERGGGIVLGDERPPHW
jgi:SlyX protein